MKKFTNALIYRQHDDNTVGANRGLAGARSRLEQLWRGTYAEWVDANLAALNTTLRSTDLTLNGPEQTLIDAFETLRATPGGPARLATLRRLGIHRQTRSGDAVLAALALTGRL